MGNMEMKKCIPCNKYFDVVSSNGVCPRCGTEIGKGGEKKASKLFGNKDKKTKSKSKQDNFVKTNSNPTPNEMPIIQHEFQNTNDDKEQTISTGETKKNSSQGKTQSAWDIVVNNESRINDSNKIVEYIDNNNHVNQRSECDYGDSSDYSDEVKNIKEEFGADSHLSNANAQIKTQPEESVSLAQEFKEKSSSSDKITVGYFGREITKKRNSKSLVVGWLVCIGGVHFGQTFPIYFNRNTIGSGDINDISLSEDINVANDNHATIIFETKKHGYYLVPGQSEKEDAYTYLNGDLIVSEKKLDDRDVIDIGDTTLLLVKLYVNDFAWEEYAKRNIKRD